MSPSPLLQRRVAHAFVSVLIALSIVNGLTEASIHLAATSNWQLAFGILKALVAVVGGLALARLFANPLFAFRSLIVWATLVALLAGMAPVVFGHAPLVTGLLSGSGAAILLGGTLAWWHRAIIQQ